MKNRFGRRSAAGGFYQTARGLGQSMTVPILLALAILPTIISVAAAQSKYPERPIRIIVPFSPGSPIDVVGRKLSEQLASRLGQPVLIENKTGAGGSIGAAEVARAQPDGYTLLLTVGDPLIGNTVVYASLGYDSRRDFQLLTQVGAAGSVLIVPADQSDGSLASLIQLSASTPGGLNFGTSGAGSFPHLLMATLSKQTSTPFVHVPYRGSTQAVQDVLAKQLAIAFTGALVAAPMIEQGTVRALAITGKQRSPLLPNVPTFAEAGFDGVVFRTRVWIGLIAPAAMPKAIGDKLVGEVQAVLRTPGMLDFMARSGFEPVGNSPEEFKREFDAEFSHMTALIKDVNRQ